jgi:hypothetical protein
MGLPNDTLARMTESEFVAKYRGRLDDQDFNTGIAKLRASKGDKDAKTLNIISVADRIEATARAMEILPATGKPSAQQAANFDKFRQEVTDRVRIYEQEVLGGKRAANSDDLKPILLNMAEDRATIPRMILPDVSKPIVSMTPKEMKEATIVVDGKPFRLAQITKAQRRQIVIEHMKQGLPTTEAEIAKTWLRKQRYGSGGNW